ncbi:protein ALP1-like [Cynara cardunculus var. scolymus]|uniref:Harbinger transposase-derived nuclease n=1 Tax=Cynara cardunculus var. scolymus TaxID=59895 RepID=A0A124SCG9_CYNCS|nr:protein ALP1-like [Cynara cardunculus var. scolymus]XP_024979187.1 protein ALP1-like [Cynara cardunculus var. scolymus]XP_024979188.1 protein ALP1-like [Cynara cardunculus var. scolymus]KVH93761.1 Harbinger transposase-derived nuclease [Cynara cardunculus var. scolymus]
MAGAGGPRNSTVAKSSSSASAKRNINTAKLQQQQQQQQTPSTRRQNLLQLVAAAASATAAAHSFLTNHDLTLNPTQTLTLESNISAVSLSISNLLSLIHHPIAFAVPRPPPPPPSWFYRFLSSENDNDQLFIESFRMSKQSFSYLLPLLTPSLSSLSIPPNYAVAATLFRLAHSATFNAVARRFDLDSPTACRVFYVVCKAIIDNLGHFFELRSDLNRIVVGFGWISLPNCCGVLGIDSFGVKGNLFGENGSVMVQALVDSEGRFLDVSAGWPNTMKPELVLRQSELFSAIEESREILNGPSYELSDGSSIPQYILGESCFPLLPWLITPFRKSDIDDDDNDEDEDDDDDIDDGCLNSKQAFNSVHNRGMELLDTAFGRLRARWRILSKEWKEESIESFPYIVVTCCLLHNFLIKSNEEFPDEDSDYMRNHNLPDYEGEGDEAGERIRSAIASDLSRWEDC